MRGGGRRGLSSERGRVVQDAFDPWADVENLADSLEELIESVRQAAASRRSLSNQEKLVKQLMQETRDLLQAIDGLPAPSGRDAVRPRLPKRHSRRAPLTIEKRPIANETVRGPIDGDVFRAARIAMKLSQGEVALQAGTTQASLSKIENGLVRPSPDLSLRLVHALAMTKDHGG